jgi:tyrosyl-tRNA synthetase
LVKRLCPDPIKDLEQSVLADHAKDPGKLSAHKKLAETVTTLVHGREGLASAKRTTEALFGTSPALLGHLTVQELTSALKGAAKVSLMLNPATTVLELGLRAKCFSREVDARRIIEEGGFYLNHRKVLFPDAVLIPGEHILPNGMTLARVGKRNNVLVQWLS